jgi:hypothetical protein
MQKLDIQLPDTNLAYLKEGTLSNTQSTNKLQSLLMRSFLCFSFVLFLLNNQSHDFWFSSIDVLIFDLLKDLYWSNNGWLGTKSFDDYVFAVSWAQKYARLNRQLMMENLINVLKKNRQKFRIPEYVNVSSSFQKFWYLRKS